MENDPKLAEAFYAKGAAYARAGFPLVSRDAFRSEGFNPYGYKFFRDGYEATFAAMTPDERKTAALRGAGGDNV